MKPILFFMFLGWISQIFGQNPDGFDKMATKMGNSSTTPIVHAKDLKGKFKNQKIYFLDARETEEYQVSHIPEAIHVGYKNFSTDKVKKVPKDAIVVVYCSVGYRSGKIGEQLKKAGYSNVYNLYGGIFEWANTGNPIYNSSGETHTVHGYNAKWSEYLNTEVVTPKI
ncbi:MAG: rhodanese-like domain-containing protein [Crocinitomicaceae bacterium]|jgi:rhodanese-related sulfurtransferase|nr:rhodanese-like domain-containing protein [Crocinitomicaceae bacterium]